MELIELKQLLYLLSYYEVFSLIVKKNERNLFEESAIISLIINDFYGGKIMKCIISSDIYYYNLIDDKIVDFIFEQILNEFPQYEKSQEIEREVLLNNEDTKIKYKKLLYNLKQVIRQNQGKKFKLIDMNGQEYLSDSPGMLGGNKK